jgi:hypothetical protein
MNLRPQLRRLCALGVLAWLNLVLAPCVAAMPAMPAQPGAAAHCEHDDASTSAIPCAQMVAQACAATEDGNADGLRLAGSVRPAALLALLPPDAAAAAPSLRDAPDTDSTGPPLAIRYCSLQN